MELNNTPVRTSKNFGINNIQLDNIEIPEDIKEFTNVQIIGDNITINNNVKKLNLKYGLGKIFVDNINNNANSKIHISANKIDENIKLIYTFDDNNRNLINYIEIEAENKCNIIIEYKSKTNKPCFLNSAIKLVAKSEVNITVINFLNNCSNGFWAIENELKENANLNYTIIDLGAKNSIQNYYSNIIGDNSNNTLRTIYLGAGSQVKDINYIAELKGKKSNIDIDVQGALKDEAKKNFKGTIDFKKGCKKAKGNENEYCMLLSPKSKSIALPMLLCTEDDVEGNHSAASGKLDNKEIFYIMSRGISFKDATKLLVKSRFNKILERIKDEEIKNEILEEIDLRLDY